MATSATSAAEIPDPASAPIGDRLGRRDLLLLRLELKRRRRGPAARVPVKGQRATRSTR